jgi:succinate dehydrogenase flavin-adding protein (antitoxin of CptAB toxin-antitoxin module)
MTELHKKSLYLASHRGTKEADHLIGGFVERFLEGEDCVSLNVLCDFLYEDDDTIMKWGKGQQRPPDVYEKIVTNFRQWLVTLTGPTHD